MNSDFARIQMVEQQVRTWDVSADAVLAVLASIQRDAYVPIAFRDVAYADTEIPLGHGQVMLRPSIEGRLLQSLDLHRDDTVLEIGTGSGYLTACIAALAGEITSIELFDDLVAASKKNLEENGVENASISQMDAIADLPDGKFDAIAVTGSTPELDERFVACLKPGGRLFTVVGRSPVKQALLVTRLQDGNFETRALFETDVPALVNAEPPPEFKF